MIKIINKILIANRGEIAERIIKTCKERGIISVAVFSDADKNSRYTKLADAAFYIGSNDLHDSYLNKNKLIEIAKQSKTDAIHPGFGFLSENAEFAKLCEKNDIIFIGPSADSIEKMGSKKTAKEVITTINVPAIPGYNMENQNIEILMHEAAKIGYPVLLKAAMGGGGKGMRVVSSEKEFNSSLEAAKREAKSSFGDDTILIEKYFTSVRHIEIQVIGDKYGNHFHLFERECSIQRRHQKIIEESPSVVVTSELRKQMTDSALRIAKVLNYYSLGTIEFIVDEKLDYYFLEVNTRIQVEHPVTEAITGLDLVSLQIDIAEGKALDLQQENIPMRGHALECRLYAENPSNNFLPETGKLHTWIEPQNVRIDSGVEQGDEITVFFDPMLAKLIVHGVDRNEAIRKMKLALRQFQINGPKNNKNFLISILESENFVTGNVNTNFISSEYPDGYRSSLLVENIHQQIIAAHVFLWYHRFSNQRRLKALPVGWRNNRFQWHWEEYTIENESYKLNYIYENESLNIKIDDCTYVLVDIRVNNEEVNYISNGSKSKFRIASFDNKCFVSSFEFGSQEVVLNPKFILNSEIKSKGDYISPMPGEVTKILVSVGDQIKIGDPLIIMVSMKMENTIEAHSDGVVEEIFVRERYFVEADAVLLKIK